MNEEKWIHGCALYSLLNYYFSVNPELVPLRSSTFSSTMLWWRPSWAERQRCRPGSCTVTSTASSRPTRQDAHGWRSSSGWVKPSGPLRRAVAVGSGDTSWNGGGARARSLLATCTVAFPLPGGTSWRAPVMPAIIKYCLSPLTPYAKPDECFIRLRFFQHQERQTNYSHKMSHPLELHTLVIKVNSLLLIFGVKQPSVLGFVFDLKSQGLSGLKSFPSPSLLPAADSVQHALCGVLQRPQRLQQGEEPQFLCGSMWVSYLLHRSTFVTQQGRVRREAASLSRRPIRRFSLKTRAAAVSPTTLQPR